MGYRLVEHNAVAKHRNVTKPKNAVPH